LKLPLNSAFPEFGVKLTVHITNVSGRSKSFSVETDDLLCTPLALRFLYKNLLGYSLCTPFVCLSNYYSNEIIITSSRFPKNWADAVSIMTLSIIRYLILKGWPPGLCYRIWFVRFIILCFLPQVIIFETLLTPCIVKPLRTQVIVFCYQCRMITSLYLYRRKEQNCNIYLSLYILCNALKVLHTFFCYATILLFIKIYKMSQHIYNVYQSITIIYL
jgi:hypothetical protein